MLKTEMIRVKLILLIKDRPAPVNQILETNPSIALGFLGILKLDQLKIRNTTKLLQQISDRLMRMGTGPSKWHQLQILTKDRPSS